MCFASSATPAVGPQTDVLISGFKHGEVSGSVKGQIPWYFWPLPRGNSSGSEQTRCYYYVMVLFPVYPNKTKAHRWCDSDAGGSGKNRPAGFCLQSSEPPAVMLPLETSTSDHVKCLTIKQQPSTVHLLTFRLISQSFFSLTPQASPVYCSYHNTFKAAFV